MAVQLNCLGSIQVTVGPSPLKKFRSEKELALLIYLGIETGQAHARQHLAALLWPEYDEKAARGSLRVAFYRLQTLLRKHDAALTKELFQARRRSIQVNVDNEAWLVDVTQFRAHLTAVSSHNHVSIEMCAECELRLKEVVALYKGDFLTNFPIGLAGPFDEWVEATRSELRQQMVATLRQLITICRVRDDHVSTIAYARQLVAIEPWQESAHRQLMRALADSGQRLAALAQFDTCCQILEEELDVSPSDETFALFQQIKTGTEAEEILQELDDPSDTTATSNLPQQLTKFFGRTTATAQLEAMLLAEERRLVTVLGVGGMGKTRLALRVGDRVREQFAAGVWFVPLERLQPRPTTTLEQQLATAVMTAFNLRLATQQSPLAQLLIYLQEKECLLILDNLEHLLADSPDFILPLLQRCPKLKILVTSREPLQLQAESLLLLQGLSLRTLDQEQDGQLKAFHLRPSSAVRLFANRAVAVEPDFRLTAANVAQVSQICHFVGGSPLAIELAAGLLQRRTLAEVAASLTTSLDALATRQRDVAQRHRSMRLTLEQSWELLDAAEQALFAQLAFFQGGCTVEALLAIIQAAPFTIDGLVERGLLQRKKNGRYHLHPLLQQFAQEKQAQHLTQVRRETLKCAFYTTYLHLLTDLAAEMTGATPHLAARKLQPELQNGLQAWRFAIQSGDFASLQKATIALGEFYLLTGRHEEGIEMIKTALAYVKRHGAAAQPLRSLLHYFLARCLLRLSRFAAGIVAAKTAVALGRAAAIETGYAYFALARLLHEQNELKTAVSQYKQALMIAQTNDHQQLEALVKLRLANVYAGMGELDLATETQQAARDAFRRQ